MPAERRTATYKEDDSLQDKSSSRSSYQERKELPCRQQSQSRREFLNEKVKEWIAGEDERYMSMRHLGRSLNDNRFQETSFEIPDEAWVHSRVDSRDWRTTTTEPGTTTLQKSNDDFLMATTKGSIIQMEQTMT